VTSLSLKADDPREYRDDERAKGSGRGVALLLVLLLLAAAGLGLLGYRLFQRQREVDRQMASLQAKSDESSALARQALDRALAAEASAREAAEGRKAAEAEKATALGEAQMAKGEADAARQERDSAKEIAAKAQAEAEKIRKQAEAEVNRLQSALGQIAETRRTALGVVMNLGSDHLKFEFDKADLQPQDRELLSRIAGILMTSHDYTISVNGHTDDVGSDAYNQKLSERRAQAVRDYLVQAGMRPEIFTVEGHGKSLPLVRGTSEEARAKNRRVELGIVNTQIRYGRQAS